jgi:hypothetical protein
MMSSQSKKTSIANSNSQKSNTLPKLTTKPERKQLIARWLVDENSQLYCKWVTKD